MGQELMNAEAFNKGPAQAFIADRTDDSLADGIGSSYGVIRYKGKVWSVRHRGVQKNVVRPDDGTPASYLDVVILSSASVKSKSFYAKYDPASSDGARPICSSIDGLLPDVDAVQKQAETCALCPRNAWKPMPNGKKGRECTDYKRLAVMLLPTTTAPLFGEAVMEPFFLRVPPASLNALAQMGEQMDARGYPYYSYVSRITFDPNESHPKMVFKAIQPLTDAEAPIIKQLRNDPQTGRIVNGDVVLGETTATAPVTLLQPPAQPAPLTVVLPPPSTPAPAAALPPITVPQTVLPASISAPPATVAPPAPSTVSPPVTVDTGFGAVATPSVTPPQAAIATPTPTAPPASVLSDTGMPSEADADLDSRIAGLLK
jgi:hypothetical protein